MASSDETDVAIQTDALMRRSVRGGALGFAVQGLRSVVRLVTQIAIARLLAPADYGLVAMVAPVLALVQLVADLGLGQAVVQRPDIKPADVSALFWLGLAINIGVAGSVALMAPAIAWVYHEPRLVLLTMMLAIVIPIAGISTQPMALLARDMRFGSLALLDVPPPIIGLVVGFAAAWFGLGYWALVIGPAAESLTTAILVWSISSWRPGFPAFGAATLSLVRVGGHITAFNITQFVTTTSDNVLLALTGGEVALGLYDKGYKTVTQSIGQLLMPANRVAVPLLVQLKPYPDQYRRAYLGMIQGMFLIAAPAIIFVIVTSKPLMFVLLGPRWDGIAPVISWLCLGSLASPLYASTYWLFVSQGHVRRQLFYGTITSIISVGSFVIGLPWGPAGVAAGAGISFFLICTPLTCRAATQTGPVSSRDLLSALLPFLAAGSVTVVALAALSRFAPLGNARLLLEFPIAYGAFFAALLALPGGRLALQDAWRIRTMVGLADGTSKRDSSLSGRPDVLR